MSKKNFVPKYRSYSFCRRANVLCAYKGGGLSHWLLSKIKSEEKENNV